MVLMAWNVFNPPLPQDGSDTASGPETLLVEDRLEGYAEVPAGNDVTAATEEQEIQLSLGQVGEPGSYELTFTNRGALLLSMNLGDFSTELGAEGGEGTDPANRVELISSIQGANGSTGSLAITASESAKVLLVEPLGDVLWEHRFLEGAEPGIEFSYAPGTGVVFRKRLVAIDGYELRFDFEIENKSAPQLAGLKQFVFTPADVVKPNGDEAFYEEPQSIAAWEFDSGGFEIETKAKGSGESDRIGPLPSPTSSNLAFAGVHNKFFAFLAAPLNAKESKAVIGASYRRVEDRGWLNANPDEDASDAWKYVVCDLTLQMPVPPVGETFSLGYNIYAGPKKRELLSAANPDFEELLDDDIGMFSPVANGVTSLLAFYHGFLGNWGWAIIFMTLTVRAFLFPLNRRAQTAMARFSKKMKRVQPLLDANKERYKDDPKKQRDAQAKIMQEEGAFPPLGGCMPMFLQIPVFIGLFQALRVHFELRHQPFILWMEDLSMPDQLWQMNLNTHLPFIGTIEYLNILPLVMIVLWIMQHKVMPQPETTDPKQEQTRKMMMGMQVFFAFLFYNYASGLALYMITSSSVAIFESLVIKRMWPIDDAELEKKKPGKFMLKM
ncbi:MAG: YidC/Oxa1 family membrane protein insertase, partial [Planctomycetota bacterium]